MNTGMPAGLSLTKEEAFALLGLCLTSPGVVDSTTSLALRKLAKFASQGREECNHSWADDRAGELQTTGA